MYKIYSKLFVLPPGRAKQMVRVMKVVTLLIFLAVMQVSAATYAQKVTLSEKNATLTKIFNEIRQQSGFDFIMSQSVLDKAKPVTIKVTNVELKEVLEQIFRDQPLEYEITDKSVLIREKAPTVLDKIKSALNLDKIDVTGRVTDENNQSLSGATVTVKGTGNATTTDINGFFVLKQVQANDIIVINFIGYDKKELSAVSNLGVVKLNVASSKLDEVKVIAYGQETMRFSVNNSVTIKAEDINKQPVSNPILALEGRAPGAFINQTSGLAGGGVKSQIQGQNSLGYGNLPLYVVDGIPYPSQGLGTALQGPYSTSLNDANGGTSSLLNFINPDDIESIALLKDADATAIYGSRAANGAILITTKKGKAGATKVDFNIQQGWGHVGKFMDLLNTTQYLQMRQEAFKNDGATPQFYDADVIGLWDTTRNVNWQKKLIGGTAQYADYNVSVSGGTSYTQFLVSATDHRETTVFPGNSADQKGGIHFSLNNTSINQKFKMQVIGSYLFDNNELPGIDLTNQALTLPPDAPPIYNPNGSLNWAIEPTYQYATWTNPLSYLDRPYRNKTSNLIGNGTFSYLLVKGLEIRTNVGYTNLQANQLSENYFNSLDPISQTTLGILSRGASYAYNNINSWQIEPQLNYKGELAGGRMDILIGGTVNDQNSNGLRLSGNGYNSDSLLADYSSAAQKGPPTTTQFVYKYEAVYGRFNYIFKDIYLLDLNVRRDGSSRFGPADRFHTFWSAGAGWIFSEEKLFKDHLSFLDYGKIRGSYGTTGNDGIGDYQFQNLYTTNGVSVPVPYQSTIGLAPGNLPNPYLQWELTKKLQVGIDLGFLKDRISIGTTYVYNRSSNELIGESLPLITGFANIQVNLPATIQNTAWEITFNATPIRNLNFRWNSSFNLTLPTNKLVAYPANASGYGTQFFVGQPLGTTPLYHFLGVDPATGQYQFADNQGNPTFSPNAATDRTVKLNVGFPSYYGGFLNSFSYRQLSLDIFLQFVKQLKANYAFGSRAPGYFGTNQPTYVLNRWQKPGDVKTIQRFNQDASIENSFNDVLLSDAAISDASYIRLKNVALSYALPQLWMKKMHVQHARLFVSGQNLMTVTKFKGMDPETGTGGLPPLRVISLGINAGF